MKVVLEDTTHFLSFWIMLNDIIAITMGTEHVIVEVEY